MSGRIEWPAATANLFGDAAGIAARIDEDGLTPATAMLNALVHLGVARWECVCGHGGRPGHHDKRRLVIRGPAEDA